jgi:hypothetical protein
MDDHYTVISNGNRWASESWLARLVGTPVLATHAVTAIKPQPTR